LLAGVFTVPKTLGLFSILGIVKKLLTVNQALPAEVYLNFFGEMVFLDLTV
jgi:hypothetical protein